MNYLKVFNNSEFGELGVLIIDGKEWFPASQCAQVLGYKNPHDAILKHCKADGVVKREGVSYTTNQHGVTSQQIVEIKYINEGNLYRLIVHSKLPKAVEFEKWVFDTVLPSIRHNGGYAPNIEELIAKTATAVVSEVLKQLIPLLTNQPVIEDIIEEVPQVKVKRRHCKSHSIISHLDTTLRTEVEEMLCDARYTYKDISDFLHKKGIKISVTSLARYYKWLDLEN